MAEHSSNMFVNTCPACERQERYLDEVNSQRNDSLREQRILQEQQEQQQREQEWAEDERAEALVAAQKNAAEKVAVAQEKVAAAQKKVADEIKKTRETDTFFKQREYAEKGDCNAQYYIGCAFENGVGTEKDIDAAISWWRKAENNGSAEAGKKLQGIYSEKLEKANKGDDKAINFIIWAFENGVGTKQDTVAAAAWTNKFERLKKDRAKALEEAALAEQAAADKKRRQQLEWATNVNLADSGNSDAQFYIGSRSDNSQKEKYLRKAAEQGHPDAQLHLAQWLFGKFLGKKYGLDDTSLLIHDADETIFWYKKYKSSHDDYNITENIDKIEANLADILLKNINEIKENIKKAKKSFESQEKNWPWYWIAFTVVLFLYILPIVIFYMRAIFTARPLEYLIDIFRHTNIYIPYLNYFHEWTRGSLIPGLGLFFLLIPFKFYDEDDNDTKFLPYIGIFLALGCFLGSDWATFWWSLGGYALAGALTYALVTSLFLRAQPKFSCPSLAETHSKLENAYVLRYPNLPKPSSLP